MERPWLILSRVVRVVLAPPGAQHADAVELAALGEAEAEEDAQAQQQDGAAAMDEEAQQAAAGEAEEHVAAMDAAAAALVGVHAAVGDAEEGAAAMDLVAQQAAAVWEAEEHVAVVDAAAEALVGGHAAVGDAQEGNAAVGEADEDLQAQLAALALQAELEDSVVNVNTDAAAAELAHLVAALGAAGPGPDFIISVAPPLRVSSLIAGLGAHPIPWIPDMYPYIIASGRFCLLAHFFGTGFNDNPKLHNHLVVVRHFLRAADGHIAACAVHVPGRPPSMLAITNPDSIGLICNTQTGDYRIAELEITRECVPSVILFSSGLGVWVISRPINPLDADDHLRLWVPHGTLAINSTVLWFDLSWGIISCNLDQLPLVLIFHRLPRGRKLPHGAVNDLHCRRCIAVSENLVRYVEIIRYPHQAAKVWMWYRDVENNPGGWILNYQMSFGDIWVDASYIQTGLPNNLPMLVGVCPVNSSVVYFTLDQRLFSINVPEHRVVDCQGYEHIDHPGLPDEPMTGRYFINWNLDADQAINIGHQPAEQSDHGDSSDNGSMDEGEIESQHTENSYSSSSNNGPMEEGEIEYQAPLNDDIQ